MLGLTAGVEACFGGSVNPATRGATGLLGAAATGAIPSSGGRGYAAALRFAGAGFGVGFGAGFGVGFTAATGVFLAGAAAEAVFGVLSIGGNPIVATVFAGGSSAAGLLTALAVLTTG